MICDCERTQDSNLGAELAELGNLRSRCPALMRLLLPDNAWQTVQTTELSGRDAAHHRSYIVLAYKRGCLSKVTLPIHKFLLDGDHLLEAVTKQYRLDLSERWLAETDAVARHERFRKFLGKLVELQVATWIVAHGWRVTGLEALGGNADILADSPSGEPCSFEVKYMGQDTGDFRQVLEAAAGRPAADSVPIYAPLNYLLFRVYEAARRLQASQRRRVVVVVISTLAWHHFDLPLGKQWIKWDSPTFLPADGNWAIFLDKQRSRYPDLEPEMAIMIPSLDRLWIMQMSGEYEYSLELDRRAGA
jgi:hypothetical protein